MRFESAIRPEQNTKIKCEVKGGFKVELMVSRIDTVYLSQIFDRIDWTVPAPVFGGYMLQEQ